MEISGQRTITIIRSTTFFGDLRELGGLMVKNIIVHVHSVAVQAHNQTLVDLLLLP